MNESLEVIGTVNAVPGVDAATLIEVMSGHIIHQQLELSKIKSKASSSQSLVESLQRLHVPGIQSSKVSLHMNQMVSSDKEDRSDKIDRSDSVSSNNLLDESRVMDNSIRESLPQSIDPIVIDSSVNGYSSPQKLLDNLDAAILAQKVLHQEATISTLQTQIFRHQQLLQRSEQDRINDRESFESNEKIAHDSQKLQYTLLQDAYDSVKEEISLLRKKLVKCEKRNVELQSAVVEQELYHHTISSIELPSIDNKVPHDMERDTQLVDELDKTKVLLRERTTQLKVLMETMDSLQFAGILQDQSDSSSMTPPGNRID